MDMAAVVLSTSSTADFVMSISAFIFDEVFNAQSQMHVGYKNSLF